MKKAQSLDQETTFYPYELFFSKTDKRGIIQSGNAVFIRVFERVRRKIGNEYHL